MEKMKADSMADLGRHAEKLGVGKPQIAPSPTNKPLLYQGTIVQFTPPWNYSSERLSKRVFISLSISYRCPLIVSGAGARKNDARNHSWIFDML